MTEQENTDADIVRLQANYPFLTYIQYGSQGILGIVQNETSTAIMMYNLSEIRDAAAKKTFLGFGDEWWWESNAELPIESFIGRAFDVFRPVLRGYIKKEVVKVVGPRVNLSETFNRRIKKKKVD